MTNDKNDKGEYALWDQGKLIGYSPIEMVDGRKVIASTKKIVNDMKAAAAKDNVILTLNSGFRTYSEQLALRKQNVIDKAKVNDEHYLTSEKSVKFNPVTAPPGWSNHQDGQAFDFMVRDDPNTKANEALAYKWLVNNAIKFGFIRTVGSERWHWELRPGKDKFSSVPKEHPTWDGLI